MTIDGRRAPQTMEMVKCTGVHAINVIHDPRGVDWVTGEGEFCFDCDRFYEDCICNPKKVSQKREN